MQKKQLMTIGLLGASLLWVGMLSLLSPSVGKEESTPAEDGSLATIKFIDKSQFYENEAGEISLRMDILGPAGDPVMGLTRERFEVREEGIDVVLKSLHGPGTQPINVILVIDVSGSMKADEKIEGAREAAVAAVDRLQIDRDRIGIIVFNQDPTVLQPLADLTPSLKKSCQQKLNALIPRGGTKIGPPTVDALQMFQDKSADGYKLLMVMTDGEDRNLSSFVEQIAGMSDEAGVQVFTIAFGEKRPRPEQVLRQIAERCRGAFYHAPTSKELAEIYRTRVEELTKEFLLTYDSPFPAADGLPRKVSVAVKIPNGSLNAANNYQIGPIIAGARRAAAKTTDADGGQATGGIGSMFAKFVLFLTLAAALLGGLAMTDRKALFEFRNKQTSPSSTGVSQSAGTANHATGATHAPPSNMQQPSRKTSPPPPPVRKPPPPVPVAKTKMQPSGQPATSPTPAKPQGTTEKRIMRKPPPPPAKPGIRKSIKPFKKPPDN